MRTYIALLRGINVGGHGKLPMAELQSLCENIGFVKVQTYIQSGNVVFQSALDAAAVVEKLASALQDKMQKPVPVILRPAEEIEAVVHANPFPDANPSQVGVLFFTDVIDKSLYQELVAPGREEIRIGEREIYVHYPDGMGRSKLKLPMEKQGTVRNINTLTRLAEIGSAY